jgi:hypothetical protein
LAQRFRYGCLYGLDTLRASGVQDALAFADRSKRIASKFPFAAVGLRLAHLGLRPAGATVAQVSRLVLRLVRRSTHQPLDAGFKAFDRAAQRID